MNYLDLFKLNISVINLGGYIKYLKYFLFDHSNLGLVKRNAVLLDSPKKNKCYICALGPSLKDVDLSKIEGDTIVVNRFYKIGVEYPDFIPNYYLIADKAFMEDKHIEDFKNLLSMYKGRGVKFILNSALSKSEPVKDYPNDQLYYTATCKGLFNSEKNICIDSVMPAFGNVACVAIATAMAIGYKEIVLLGCDFNSFAQVTQSHCYTDDTTKRQINLDFELFCYSFDANMHKELQKYAEMHNVKIFNSTVGSLIDAYPIKIEKELYRNIDKDV